MKLKFIKSEDTDQNAKATVHTTGKLGFSKDAVEFLGIKEGKSIQFAQNEDDPADLNLYAVVNNGIQEGAFRINKAGAYFYVNTKNLLDALGVDYKNKKIIYDRVKADYEGMPIVKMLRREIKKRSKGMPGQ